jgi:phage terminase large subunit-like protein
MSAVDELVKKKRLLEAKKSLMQRELPHLYLFKWYRWAWDFFNSTNKITLLCAANQISKSSTQIRRFIDWATDDTKWEDLWPNQVPNLFWYFYPTKEVATVEFFKKWSQFLPAGSMKDDPKYGWKPVFAKSFIDRIEFNSGVSIYFKSYNQSVMSLQSSTVFAVGCDEELPETYYDELMFRLAATDGYFSMAFTATIGQELWWRAMECVGKESEFLPDAHKIQVSMYDCMEYRDGSETPWTEDRIKKIIDKCKSKAEVLRRVYGRFVKEGGKTYHTFDPAEHYIAPNYEMIRKWHKYCAVDIGSGGSDGHPSAIIFIAVKPDGTQGVVYKGWRGDGIQTTAGDVYNKYLELKGRDVITRKWYDWASADFNAITTRLGDPFEKANKSHDLGEDLVNTLYSNNMLKIFNTEELRKLGGEMITLQKSTPKNKAKDDFIDAQRYCAVEIPWNLTKIKSLKGAKKVEKKYKMPQNQDEWNKFHDKKREDSRKPEKKKDLWGIDSEIDFWNNEY